MQTFPTWEVQNHADQLEPADDVMKRLTDKYGPTNQVCEYLAKVKGHWMAVPSVRARRTRGRCGRISVLKTGRARRAGDVSRQARHTPRVG